MSFLLSGFHHRGDTAGDDAVGQMFVKFGQVGGAPQRGLPGVGDPLEGRLERVGTDGAGVLRIDSELGSRHPDITADGE